MRGARLVVFCLLALAFRAAGEEPSDEIKIRIKWWELHHREYTPNTYNGPVVQSPSVTVSNAVDRTGSENDPLVRDFVARGYFLLGALHTKREMAPLSPAEILAFQKALRSTRVEFVDTELFDNEGKRVVAIMIPDPSSPRLKVIRVYRYDWTESQRLGVDLVRLVFHEYLRVIAKPDENYVTAIQLLVTERDFQKRRVESPECLSGERKSAHISLNISSSYAYAQSPSYVEGRAFDSQVPTSFRVFNASRVCTSQAYRFAVSIGNFTKTVFLYGGDSITVFVPDGQEIYRP